MKPLAKLEEEKVEEFKRPMEPVQNSARGRGRPRGRGRGRGGKNN